MASFKRIAFRVVLTAAVVGAAVWSLFRLESVRRVAIAGLSEAYVPPTAGPANGAMFDGPDAARARLPITLVKVAEGFSSITDVQFVPGSNDVIVVLQKAGRADWVKLNTPQHGRLFEVTVPTESELGLLGLAFHPRFQDNGKFYVNYNAEDRGKLLTRIAEWQATRDADGQLKSATEMRSLLEVEQPYQNHNGGQLAFGPDGFLYIGLGDGGYRDDPDGAGQDKATWLGKMLRIDVDNTDGAQPYAVPRDNPFVGSRSVRPEIWAYGLRNPWRYSFDPTGRMVIADVGQDSWEEISIAGRGDNLGWNVREGRVCFRDTECKHSGMKDPVYVYGRNDGQSITGGFVYTADDFPELKGKYVFADFLRGRFWAFTLPSDARATVPDREVFALGRFPILPSTFARDAAGRVYVADFGGGAIYQLVSSTRKASL